MCGGKLSRQSKKREAPSKYKLCKLYNTMNKNTHMEVTNDQHGEEVLQW